MPVSIGALTRARRQLKIETNAGTLNVVYAPNALTPADSANLFNAKGLDAFRELMRQLEAQIVEWDLEGPLYEMVRGEDGESVSENLIVAEGDPVPPKKEYLQHIPQSILGDLYQELQEAVRPKPKTSTPSGGLFEVTNRPSPS